MPRAFAADQRDALVRAIWDFLSHRGHGSPSGQAKGPGGGGVGEVSQVSDKESASTADISAWNAASARDAVRACSRASSTNPGC
jgi:hypothetical protein